MEITDQPLHIKWELIRAQSREKDERIVINIYWRLLENVVAILGVFPPLKSWVGDFSLSLFTERRVGSLKKYFGTGRRLMGIQSFWLSYSSLATCILTPAGYSRFIACHRE